MNKEKFGPFLHWLRLYWQMPTEFLAARLAVSPEEVTAWEEGRAYPTEEQLLVLSGIFYLSVNDLKACVLPTAPQASFPQAAPTVPFTPQARPEETPSPDSPPSEGVPQTDASKKKRMTPGKWVAIFVPAGILTFVMLILMIVGITFGTLNAAKNTEEYRVAYDYLVQTAVFKANEDPDEEVDMTAYSFNYSDGVKTTEITFETDDYVYVILLYEEDGGIFVEEDSCYYYDEDLFFGDYQPLIAVPLS